MFWIVAVFPVNGLFTLTLSKNGGMIRYTFSVRDVRGQHCFVGFSIMSYQVSREIKREGRLHVLPKNLETQNEDSKERNTL